MNTLTKPELVAGLQADINRLEGFKGIGSVVLNRSLGPIQSAFPTGAFPLGTVNEFFSGNHEDRAASAGFIAGLLSTVIGDSGTFLWISSSRILFPPALVHFGIDPDRCIFIDLRKEKDAAWVMEEGLKCNALAAVVGEIQELSFTSSRRLQLAVEQSQVTGFILRNNSRQANTTACYSRWKIASMQSHRIDDLPGIGFPAWKVELLRIRNGKPGVWEIHCRNGRFLPMLDRSVSSRTSHFDIELQQQVG